MPPDNETRHARFPLSNFPPHAGERANESLREFHVYPFICKPRASAVLQNGDAQNQAVDAFTHQTSAKNICRCRVMPCADVAKPTFSLVVSERCSSGRLLGMFIADS